VTQQPVSPLIDLPDTVLWSSRTWTDFARLSPRQRESKLVLLPLFGFGDWGLGCPLDLEEQIGTAVLRHAIEHPAAKAPELMVMPPLRFVLGPYVHNLFGIDFETALDLLHEIAASVRAAGFRKLLLFTTSPWNEELIDVAGRAMRVRLGMQAFQITLAALGLDLHPTRSLDRTPALHAACSCYRRAPRAAGMPIEAIGLREFRPGNIQQPGPLRLTLSLDDAIDSGDAAIAATAGSLSSLCSEIVRKPALPDDGRIATRRAREHSGSDSALKPVREK